MSTLTTYVKTFHPEISQLAYEVQNEQPNDSRPDEEDSRPDFKDKESGDQVANVDEAEVGYIALFYLILT